MSIKSFVVILVLSIVVTYGVAMFGFVTENIRISDGFPLAFTKFNFLGSSTNYLALMIDIVFWFFVIWVIWKVFKKILGR